MATMTAAALVRRHRRLEAVEWWRHHWSLARTRLRWFPRETEAMPGKRMHLRGRGWRRRTVVVGGAAGGWPAPEREKEKAGRGGAATGERGRGLKLENGPRGFHFIGWGREPGTGEVGTAAEKSAGGHGKRPGLARAFRVIKSTNQGGNMGERERNKWVLLPPI
uniref:Uncharacterized protein n=1 Tax=Oryza sativa subsp. japonica TaxID=39947 RepID=Q339L9_ORYSJ|nr:hypothetical protein LOC_Os10g20420 [Oryza sativa Japonica Group]